MSDIEERTGLKVVDEPKRKNLDALTFIDQGGLGLPYHDPGKVEEWRLDSQELAEIRAELGVPSWQRVIEAIRRLVR